MSIMLINVKMPTIVGILTFMSMIILCSVELSTKKVYNLVKTMYRVQIRLFSVSMFLSYGPLIVF